MTAAELARLCERATPGPWVAEPYSEAEEGIAVIASNDANKVSNPSRGMVAWVHGGFRPDMPEATVADGKFIAAARTEVPRLLRDLVRIHKALEQAWLALNGHKIGDEALIEIEAALKAGNEG